MSSTAFVKIEALLESQGAILSRQKKHYVYSLPDGRKWTVAKTPSDAHAYDNNLADLKTFLGVHDNDRGKPGARRPKKQKSEPTNGKAKFMRATLAEQLK